MTVIAAREAEVLTQPSLQDLEETVRREHQACLVAAKATLEHATSAGEALLAIRERKMLDRSWTAWLREQPYHRSTMYCYMRIAQWRELLPDDMTISRAAEFLTGLPAHQKRAAEALRKQRQKSAAKRAVTKAGGALAETYSIAERLDDILGQAYREAAEPEARCELAKAHEYQRAMRDAVVRALGVEP